MAMSDSCQSDCRWASSAFLVDIIIVCNVIVAPNLCDDVNQTSLHMLDYLWHIYFIHVHQTCQVYWFGLTSRLPVFLTSSTSLLGDRPFLLVLKKNHFWYLNFFSDFYFFFVCIHCLMIGSLQPVTKYMLFDN